MITVPNTFAATAEAIIHYPIPLHLQPAFAGLGYRSGAFPVAERAAGRIVSLPLCGEITEEEVREVCNAIGEFV